MRDLPQVQGGRSPALLPSTPCPPRPSLAMKRGSVGIIVRGFSACEVKLDSPSHNNPSVSAARVHGGRSTFDPYVGTPNNIIINIPSQGCLAAFTLQC